MLRSVLTILQLLSCAGTLLASPRSLPLKDDDRSMHPRDSPTGFSAAGPRPFSSFVTAELAEQNAEFWRARAQATLREHLARQPITGRARNVILFMGDGMSIPTLTAARVFGGGEQSSLAFESFPSVGLSKTYCVNSMVPDSACSSTAYLSGVKANIGTLGVTAAVARGNCTAMRNASNHVTSFIRHAQVAGKATGIVTSTRVSHASPGGSFAHVADREWEADVDVVQDGQSSLLCDDVTEQLVRGRTGRNLQVILGGGRETFRPSSTLDEEGHPGRRLDGVDLIREWRLQKSAMRASHAYVWDRATLEAVNLNRTEYLLGLFEPSHLQYYVENDPRTKPSLGQLTRAAITVLARQSNGFALFVEGGRIDHAHHFARSQIALQETLQFEEAVKVALSMTNPRDTLIVVTSDHAHTMSLGGYPSRGASVTGLAAISNVDGLPYSVLSYANGPGYKNPGPDGSRYDLSKDNFDDPMYQHPATAPLLVETHGGDDVAVFASGPWSHLFTGSYEQTLIHHAMCYASCIGPGLTACT